MNNECHSGTYDSLHQLIIDVELLATVDACSCGTPEWRNPQDQIRDVGGHMQLLLGAPSGNHTATFAVNHNCFGQILDWSLGESM